MTSKNNMVRNRKGGSKHKKQSSKNTGKFASYNIKTRLKNPKESDEMYAIVISMYGQGNCQVMCNDKKKRLCVIRNKFRGRNKWSNNVSVGSYVLVGLRNWEVLSEGKKEKCDLLEVYSSKQYDELKKDQNFNEVVLRTEEDIAKERSEKRTGSSAEAAKAAKGVKTYVFKSEEMLNQIMTTSKEGHTYETHTEFDELNDLDIDDI